MIYYKHRGIGRRLTGGFENTPCILVASKGQQRAEQAYYRDIFNFRGDFLFADRMDEARVMVVQNNGFMPIDDGAEQGGDTRYGFLFGGANTPSGGITARFGKWTTPVNMWKNLRSF